MREILFRGKGNPKYNDGSWYEGYLKYDGEDYQILDAEYGSCARTVLPETVGQYTGLTDKNGMRIFEGDLIRSTETGETGIVQWFSEHSAFMIWCKTSNQVGFLYECEKSIIEIIGNIHDNPELIGGDKND